MHAADGNRSLAYLTGFLRDEEATSVLGRAFADVVVPGLVIFLNGDLGAGKTTLVRGVLRGLGCREKVKSPTYTLVELYELSRLDLYHFDFYRFNSPEEWGATGFREYFDRNAALFVEWPEKAGAHLPQPDLRIRLAIAGSGRSVELEAETERGNACLDRLRETLPAWWRPNGA